MLRRDSQKTAMTCKGLDTWWTKVADEKGQLLLAFWLSGHTNGDKMRNSTAPLYFPNKPKESNSDNKKWVCQKNASTVYSRFLIDDCAKSFLGQCASRNECGSCSIR